MEMLSLRLARLQVPMLGGQSGLGAELSYGVKVKASNPVMDRFGSFQVSNHYEFEDTWVWVNTYRYILVG
jgi:hypothetical protein